MRPTSITLTGSGAGVTNSDPVRVNWRSPHTSLDLDTDGNTTGFTAQYTLTAPNGYASAAAWAAAAEWIDVTGISTATGDSAATITGGIQGIRLQANANATDTGILHIIQTQ